MSNDNSPPQFDADSLIDHGNARVPGASSRWPWWVAWLVITIGLTVWRFEVIDSPPYWDFGQGLWHEANYLAETNFDYQRLWYEEKRIWEGGADCYRTSILPTVVAVLMKIGPPPFAQIAFHLLTFACTAAILLLTYALLLPRGGAIAAGLACTALLTTPLFGVQVDMLGMEVPTILFALLTLWCVMNDRFSLAAVFGTMAFLLKATGLLVTATTVAFILSHLLVGSHAKDPKKRWRFAWGLGANTLALAFQALLVAWGGHIESQMIPAHREGAPSLLMAKYLCPDVLLLGLAATITLCGMTIALIRRPDGGSGSGSNRLIHFARLALRQQPLMIWSMILIAANLVAVSRIIFLPRYLILAIPFLYIGTGSVLFEQRRLRRLTMVALAVITLFNLANSHGRFFPPIEAMFANEYGVDPTLVSRSGAFLERSWEYLADHNSNIAACREMERQCQHDDIFAPTPLLHYLCFPRLGYVEQPLHGFAVSDFTDFVNRFKDVTIEAPVQRPRQAVFVWVGNTFSHVSARFRLERPHAGDEILYDDRQPSPLIVYRRTIADEVPDDSTLEQWYLDRIWPTASPLSRKVYRTHYYLATDRLEKAIHEVESIDEEPPNMVPREILLARLDLRKGDYSTALNRLHTYRQDEDSLAAVYEVMRLEKLHRQLDPIVPPESDEPSTLLAHAEGYWRRGHAAGAKQYLGLVLDRDPHMAEAHFLQGMLALDQRQLNQAVVPLEHTLTEDADHLGAQVCLGWLRLYRGEYNRAEAHFRSVLDRDPRHAGAKGGLGILLESTGQLPPALDMFAALGNNEDSSQPNADEIRVRTRLPERMQPPH